MYNNNDLQFATKTKDFIVFTHDTPKSNFLDGSFSWDVRFIPVEGVSLKSFKEGVKTFLGEISYKTNSAFTGRVIREFGVNKKRCLLFVEEELIVNDELIKFINGSFRLDKHEFGKRLLDAGWEII